jgi:hypothetical protein
VHFSSPPRFATIPDRTMLKHKWLRFILVVAVLLPAASVVFSRALRSSAARRYLTAHLAASFGRPVDVSWFDFSLFDGARIEAHLVTVSEDPRFGNEYFLRADTVTAGLRWSALLAGRFEFGDVSLSRPSLNLVRDAQGNWNIERWLPPASAGVRPGFVGPISPSAGVRATRPSRIDVDGGRINFKQGDNKSPFALVAVSGRVEQSAGGRWQLDLEARPMRAGVELQDMGTMSLRGSMAGTTARLQPAELALAWRAASLADALRIVRGDDYGLRGRLALDLSAHIAPPGSSDNNGANDGYAQWSIFGVARLTGLHGWRLTERETDPSANLSVEMSWRLGQPHVEFRKVLLDMPQSHLEGTGGVDWARGPHPELHLVSSTLALNDVLSWYRAVRPGVAEDLQTQGTLGLDLKLGGWPIQLEQGTVASAGGILVGKSQPVMLRIGALRAAVVRGGIEFGPTGVSVEGSGIGAGNAALAEATELQNSFVARGSLMPPAGSAFRWPPDWAVSFEGATSRVQDWLRAMETLALPVNSGWTASGGLAVNLRGNHTAAMPANAWLGTVDFAGLTLNPAYVNQALHFPKTHIEFTSTNRAITLFSADGFGTNWHGSISRKPSDKQWLFDLTAEHLDALELDRWLGPRARPGFFARLTGADPGAAADPPPDSVVTRLAARGRLRIGAIDLPPLHIEKFDGQAELDGRSVQIVTAQADFFGGKISGSLDAQLAHNPSYKFQGRFDRVDLALLGRGVPSLTGRIGGIASATLTLSAHGVGRQDLIDSMEGQGTLNGRNAVLRGFDLSSAIPGNPSDGTPDLFALVQGAFRIQDKSIELSNFILDHSHSRLAAEGRIDFSHALNIRVRPSIFQAAVSMAPASPPSFLLGGTLESPKPILSSAVPKPPARGNPR